ncbi:carbohydrate ABC transporter permease [Paenibacillus whitsoniae]|uniref:Carbohydrate ABC transporter permease n=1 Tax=Paenibacillus whitsoniae TaxID=2496558 RepID=A0A3S0A763_9BACL|nr:carbohydrate ABC transporter permease [Paenibacillus whitsoniae]RTE03069.1 carbohydrate ABC transporter permease [Paenibacillus whitsoniae]
MERMYRVSMNTIVGLVAVVFLLPVAYMIALSFKTEGVPFIDGGALHVSLVNYHKVLSEAPIFHWMWNSLLVAVIQTFIIVLVDSLAAFAISRIKFPGSKWLFLLFLMGLMIPAEATLIPIFLMMRDWGLLNTLYSLILPGIASPFGIFVLKQFFDGLPNELEEAARMDGAGYWRIWSSIFIPLSRPAFAALAIYSFLAAWNDFLWPLISISNRTYMTITLGLPNFQSSYMQQYSLPMTANTLAAIPLIIVFIFFQKQIIKGIAFTGGKE